MLVAPDQTQNAQVLVVNAGSSSLKRALFDAALTEVRAARITEIDAAGHGPALLAGLAQMGVDVAQLTAAAHRVVHGGADLTAPCRLTAQAIAAIDACTPLAPLHNPANLLAIRALAALAPDLPQYASFDTAFHATNPAVATRYAIAPRHHVSGLRRYGFHGLSYAGLVQSLRAQGNAPLPARLLALHLGNGASLCAVLNGQSVATTMGYSPLDGLTMGTRVGSIDGNAVLALAQRHGIDGAAHILNRESGLLGLGGHSDMRALHAAGTPEARFAVQHFCYWAVRHAGAMMAAMGGLDAIAFTGGIGENDLAVRTAILDHLAWAAAGKQVYVVPAAEERQIAQEAMTEIAAGR